VKTLIDVKHETASKSLCESKHQIEVGVTQDANGVIVPLQSYLLVGFTATDTSGGGKVEEWFNKAVGAPMQFINWAGNGLADYSREQGVVYGEGVVGGTAQFVNEGLFGIGKNAKTIWNESKLSPKNWFAEENYSPLNYTPFNSEFKADWFGTDYHPVNASSHKMRFQAWCLYEGKERKMFDSEISGCTPLLTNDECLACCDSTTFEEFLISSPGEWRIKVSSVATGSCASLDYENEATFTVPTPEGWEPQPIYATLTSLSTDISQAVGFEVPPAYLAIGGSILIGGIAFKILRKN